MNSKHIQIMNMANMMMRGMMTNASCLRSNRM